MEASNMDSFNNNFNDDENSSQNKNFGLNSINILENDNNVVIKQKKKKKYNLKLKKKILFKVLVSILVSVIAGNIIGFGIGYSIPKFENYFNSQTEEVDLQDNSNDSEEVKEKSPVNPISKASESVVSIMAVSNNNDRLDIFGTSRESQNAGSGIIFHQTSKNIYIVTNYHVISGAKNVNVSFGNDKFVSASLVGRHQLSDIAVISVSRESLKNIGITSVKTAYFGNSDKLNVGDNVIAIGNAFGAGNIATRGIVSVIQKDIPITQTDNLSVIQTDAAINNGNDGGALINTNGEVIGINTAKYAYYAVEGVGYSISSNIAKPVIEEIMNKRETPYLGVTVKSITEQDTEESDLPQMGVIVKDVVHGGPANRAGIQIGDVITGFNSTPIFTPTQLTEAVRKCNVGDTVEIDIVRNGKTGITLEATISQDTMNNF